MDDKQHHDSGYFQEVSNLAVWAVGGLIAVLLVGVIIVFVKLI